MISRHTGPRQAQQPRSLRAGAHQPVHAHMPMSLVYLCLYSASAQTLFKRCREESYIASPYVSAIAFINAYLLISAPIPTLVTCYRCHGCACCLLPRNDCPLPIFPSLPALPGLPLLIFRVYARCP